ncbi:zinc finger protein castor homolog 1 isoform X1 [Lates japonicus]|uniref:Zinc finger protein castor homolog 1 isoform X1 n=1 Tax=Lates japonicus TaxID=270547 RepID=A0AAD3NID0_LATJO|nr:zinc finger protein castor homolog 1 isoform X1 [Lates japonicus]
MGLQGGASPDVGTGKDYNSWWCSWSRTGPRREPGQLLRGAELSPGCQAELHLWASSSSNLTDIAPLFLVGTLGGIGCRPLSGQQGAWEGNGQPASASQFNLVQVKQEPVDGNSGASQDSTQEHSLDLSKKDHSNESNGHPVPGNTSLLSSLMNKMSQVNPALFNAMNLKTELEQGQGGDTSEAAQYLNRVLKRPLLEKPTEIWRTYLRRFDTDDFCEAQCDFLQKVHFHCLVEDCGALFSTVDGAIKHANFHLRATLKVKPEPQFGEGKDSSEGAPLQPAAPVSMANNSSMDMAHLTSSGGYSSPPPSLLAWKQLTGSIPQMPASMPNLPANSPLATTSLENAKPQVKPGFLQFQENDPCLATDCKYSNKFHFHCLFGNCKYVCKTSGKAESHCLDHINPNNNLVNVRDQFSYYSLQCLCPNQHCEFRMRGHYHCLRPGCFLSCLHHQAAVAHQEAREGRAPCRQWFQIFHQEGGVRGGLVVSITKSTATSTASARVASSLSCLSTR